jgi:hypothetical protein
MLPVAKQIGGGGALRPRCKPEGFDGSHRVTVGSSHPWYMLQASVAIVWCMGQIDWDIVTWLCLPTNIEPNRLNLMPLLHQAPGLLSQSYYHSLALGQI